MFLLQNTIFSIGSFVNTVKFSAFFVAIVLLTSCGYSTLYNAQSRADISSVSVGTVAMNKVEKDIGERRVAQLFSQRLRQTLHGSNNASYTLNVSVQETNITLAVRRDATAQRFQISLIANASLLDTKNNKVVKKFTVTASSPYNVEDSPFGTDSGKERARKSAAKLLADELIYKLTIYLRKNTEK